MRKAEPPSLLYNEKHGLHLNDRLLFEAGQQIPAYRETVGMAVWAYSLRARQVQDTVDVPAARSRPGVDPDQKEFP